MIRGKKVDLVALSADYLSYYHKWINDPEVTDMLGVGKLPLSMHDERQWLEHMMDPKTEGRTFTIVTKKGEPIGNVGFNHLTYQNRHGTIGIMIGEKDFWDKGYGTDAIDTILRFGFEELGLRMIELVLNADNARALACYEKCGFVMDGRSRQHTFHNGKYVDDLHMSVLAEEWLRLSKKK